jgi:hypothetical protein
METIFLLKHMNLYEPLKEVVKEMVEEHLCCKKETRESTTHEITEEEAKEIVDGMYHCFKGKKYTGWVFDYEKAKCVFKEHHLAATGATVPEVYIAINAQYHDYCKLMYNWFGTTNIEDKVIEAAITFWFMDEDYKHTSKVYKYFKG